MTGGPRERFAWLMAAYEKIILGVMLVILLLSAVVLLYRVGRVSEQLKEAQWDKPPAAPKMAQPLDLTALEEARTRLIKPFQLDVRGQRLAVSELRVSCVACRKPIPYTATVCPFCGAAQPAIVDPEKLDSDGDGIPDRWESKYGMNPLDRTDAEGDLDGDGFSNLEEFAAGTDPMDPASSPPRAAKLRVARVYSEPFFLRFQGVNEIAPGVFQYQLNLRTLERTYFVKIGDKVLGFEVVGYQPDAKPQPIVQLQQGDKKINLVKGMAVQQEELVAQLMDLVDRRPIKARVGDVVKLGEEEYKVVDIRKSGVVIRDLRTDRDLQVPPLSSGELKTAPTGSAGPVLQSEQ